MQAPVLSRSPVSQHPYNISSFQNSDSNYEPAPWISSLVAHSADPKTCPPAEIPDLILLTKSLLMVFSSKPMANANGLVSDVHFWEPAIHS